MLDTLTLRVAFGVVAVTLLVLFYVITYRLTRSIYCGWWCLSLAMFVLGSCAYLLDGTAQQVWANPTGNVLIVFGAVCVWAGARSLRAARLPVWQMGTGPALVLLASVVDHPASNVWSGGPVFLALMSALVGLASAELWVLQREPGSAAWLSVVRSMATVSGGFALFYLARCIAFLAVGQDGAPFTTIFGSQVTTLMTMVLLATVSVSMSSLSHEQQTRELRARADRDPLTGLLNRAAFMPLALLEERRVSRGGEPAALVIADLDNFKSVNDTHGHAAGDQVVCDFATACNAAVRASDLVGRIGGDEFVLLMPGASAARAARITADIRTRLATARTASDPVTASFGIATLRAGDSVDSALARADSALYAAKAAGRDRTVTEPARGASEPSRSGAGAEAGSAAASGRS
jgi:diguanylate cyclase (GGDEF)-like protein